jgi:hypothetical protein
MWKGCSNTKAATNYCSNIKADVHDCFQVDGVTARRTMHEAAATSATPLEPPKQPKVLLNWFEIAEHVCTTCSQISKLPRLAAAAHFSNKITVARALNLARRWQNAVQSWKFCPQESGSGG